MKRVALVAAKRTPVGTFGGMFTKTDAIRLGEVSLRAAIDQAGISADQIDEVIYGNILSAGLGPNVARQVTIKAGLPETTPAFSVNKLCGSGLKSVVLGMQAIFSGDARIIAAGGTENMSQSPYVVPKARFGARMGTAEMLDTMIHDALWDPFGDYHMGETAEKLADQWDITREEMDEFAAESQRRAIEAIDAGRFEAEIAGVPIPQKSAGEVLAETDEHPRRGVTAEGLAKLRPAFRKDGRVTAGNASGINDGAATVILADEEMVQKLGLKPLAWIVGHGEAALDPSIMGYGPVPATKKALAKAGWSLSDVQLAELNEAFAAQSLAVLKGFEKELGGIDPKVVNVNGGAIALGHPVGASGTRILVTLLHEMIRRDSKRGLATLCIGGGMGISLLVER